MRVKRRDFCRAVAGVLLAGLSLPTFCTERRHLALGAAWRGPRPSDPHFADWEARTLRIRYAVQVPSRPHGLLAEPDGGLTVCAFRPGGWILRCDGAGHIVQRVDVADESPLTRLAGHAIASADGQLLYTSETDYRSGEGRIGVRDRTTLRKLDEWRSGGVDPHHLLLDGQGRLIVANGGVHRTLSDEKVALEAMDSSLVRIDPASGRIEGQWRLADRRLSLRHMAWNQDPSQPGALLGIAMQAEHASASARASAPILAVFDGEQLTIPTQQGDGVGYSGDIAPAYHVGFVLSSHEPGLVQLWHPAIPDKLQAVVKLQYAYALAPWHGPGRGGGIAVATALGLALWHPEITPTLLPWPQPMALDNHWVLVAEA